jgi:hypothetical protein
VQRCFSIIRCLQNVGAELDQQMDDLDMA